MTKMIVFCITVVFSSAGFADIEIDQSGNLEASRNTAQQFMQALGSTLKKQLEAGGAENAIGVCKHIAPAMAADYSKDGRVVKRVSLKNRNPTLGVPDDWEREILQQFEQSRGEGKPAANMEMTAIVEESDGRWFRYMKAIPTQPMCLQCHGAPEVMPEGVKAILAKEYPDDKAIGYQAGDIRGAVSIKKRLSGGAS